MPLRYRRVLPLVAVCLALTVAQAFAAKPEPTKFNPGGPLTEHGAGSVTATATACAMGVQGPAALAYGYILAPDDQYYTLLNPANCASCGADPTRLIQTAHMELLFDVSCEIPVSVSIMPAFDNNGCYEPNPFAPPTCQPVQYIINDGGQLNTCVDYALNLAGACCVDGPAFLMFEFDQGTCATSRPYFCGPGACSNCTQYNFYPGATFPGDDLCAVLTPFGVFGNIMWADSQCCTPTSTLPGSWGSLKTLYR